VALRCVRIEKPLVGALHLRRSWWAPWRVGHVWFEPVGRRRMYWVPLANMGAALEASTFEQAMVVVVRERMSRVCRKHRHLDAV
jgi:hypothetical protein